MDSNSTILIIIVAALAGFALIFWLSQKDPDAQNSRSRLPPKKTKTKTASRKNQSIVTLSSSASELKIRAKEVKVLTSDAGLLLKKSLSGAKRDLKNVRIEIDLVNSRIDQKTSNERADLFVELKKLEDLLEHVIKEKVLEEKALQDKRLSEARESRLEREAKEKKGSKSESAEILLARHKAVAAAIDQHYNTLRRNFNRCLRINDYGGIEEDTRQEEFQKFLSSVGFVLHWGSLSKQQNKNINNISLQKINGAYRTLLKRIEKDEETEISLGFDPETLPDDGYDFEHWVAANLQKFGWTATVSTGSGDQGVDVIAHINDFAVAIQCKRYTGSVGNKAVQEVIAGAKFYEADFAAVITNSKYTKSAISLAASNGVLLLSHKDIPKLESIVKSL